MYLIADVMVRPDCQRLGVGKAMLVRINEWLEMVGKDGLCVMANLMATKGNEGFYEKLGFNEVDIRKNYYPKPDGGRENAVVMACYL